MLDRIFGLPSFGLAVALGTLCTFLLATYLARREGYDKDTAVDAMLIAMIGGVIGSRTLHVIQFWSYFEAQPWHEVFRVDKGGLSWYGCFAVIIPAAWIYCRKKRYHPLAFIDLFTITIPMGQLFGRLGCFGHGCCFGQPVAPGSPLEALAVRFPTWSPAWGAHAQQALGRTLTNAEMARMPTLPQGLPAHLHDGSLPILAVQPLMSIMGLLAVVFFLVYYGRHTRHGQPFAATFGLLAFTRFLFESVRADEVPGLWGLTESQWTSAAATLVAVALFVVATRWGTRYAGPLEGRGAAGPAPAGAPPRPAAGR